MNHLETIRELLEVISCYKNYVEAIPEDTVLPAMPGFDRDWADGVEEDALSSVLSCEVVDFEKLRRDKDPFCHLLLQGEVKDLIKSEGYDSSDLQVNLSINGFPVKICDFNEVLEGWFSRIRDQIKVECGHNKTEGAVVRKAEKLIQDRLGNINDVLHNIENSLWKLED